MKFENFENADQVKALRAVVAADPAYYIDLQNKRVNKLSHVIAQRDALLTKFINEGKTNEALEKIIDTFDETIKGIENDIQEWAEVLPYAE